MKHHETLLKRCETSQNTRTLTIRCDAIGARYGDISSRHGDIGVQREDMGARRGDIGTARSFHQYQGLLSFYNSSDV